MKNVAIAVWKKEVREVLRDKRTLFLAVFLPLLFYPMMLGMSIYLSESEQEQRQQKRMVFGYANLPSDFKLDSSVDWEPLTAEDLEGDFGRGLDAAVVGGEKGLKLYHRGVQMGDQPGAALMHAVHDYKGMELVQWQATRAEVGSKFGGAGAYFMIFLAFTGCMSVAVDAGAGERERGTLEAIMATPASLLGVAAGKFLFVVMMGILSVVSTIVGIGLLMLGRSASWAVIGNFVDVGFTLAMSATMVSTVVLFSSVLYGVSVLAKSSREAHLRSSLMMMGVALLLICAGSDTISSSDWVHFVPIMNTAVVIKQAISGNLEVMNLIISVGVTGGFSLLVLYIVTKVLTRLPERVYLSQ